MTVALELDDIQGIVARAYPDLRAACFLLLGVRDPVAAGAWLHALCDQVTSARSRPEATAVNVAFTPGGLRALGQPLEAFATEFVQGMADVHRSRPLGDVGANDPSGWRWGGPATSPVHLALLLYAKDEPGLESLSTSLSAQLAANGLDLVVRLDTSDLDEVEHFGFRDGISQPLIEGLSKTGPASNTVKAGEFILGYPNEYGLYTDRPLVAPSEDSGSILPRDPAGSGQADLGRNGSYLVLRQLEQDVVGFWRFLGDAKHGAGGAAGSGARLALAAKMVGRWPSGAPLVLAPDADDPSLGGANDFGYFAEDRRGTRCPIGAHIRRAYPRDSLDPRPGSQASIDVGKGHRILRRGREYGPPISNEQLEAGDDGGLERGLYFLCLNANLARQFEFIQHTWVNNAKFSGLYDDPDPLVGARNGGRDTFTVQAEPVRSRVRGLPQFVTVKGGAYFFLPGIQAIRYLTTPRKRPTAR